MLTLASHKVDIPRQWFGQVAHFKGAFPSTARIARVVSRQSYSFSPNLSVAQNPKAGAGVTFPTLVFPSQRQRFFLHRCVVFLQFKSIVLLLILQFSDTNWVSYNLIHFWHWAQTPEVKGSVPQPCPYIKCQPQRGPRLPSLLPSWLQIWVSMIPTKVWQFPRMTQTQQMLYLWLPVY